MSTAEIVKAISHLSSATLIASLKTVHDDVDEKASETELQNKYTETVLATGLNNFIERLNPKDIADSCKAVGADPTSSDPAAALSEALKTGGINLLLSKADDTLLKTFCGTLGLQDPTERSNMIKEIADETMLTGMESFLNKISASILKRHCIEMKLNGAGNKYNLVERLMVSIFQLEPLAKEGGKEETGRKKGKAAPAKKETKEKEPAKPKAKSPKAKTEKKTTKKDEDKASPKTSPRSSPKRGRSADKEEKEKEKLPAKRGRSTTPKEDKESPSKKQKRSTSTKRSVSPVAKTTKPKRATPSPSPKKTSPKKATPSGKKEKWVSPAQSTIAKGQFDNKIALYDNFNLPDLVKFAKDHNLPSSGKKNAVIKVIVDFLDGKQPAEKKPKKVAKKKAASPAAKKQKTTAAPKKTAAEK